MRICIIENEANSLNLLKQILDEYFLDMTLVGTSGTIIDSVPLIEEQQPDLVFFDIELDDGDSFKIFDQLAYRDFIVIFTTAYDEYAVKAFQYDALDYILKPYSPSQVVKAVTKAKDAQNKELVFQELSLLLKSRNNRQSITIPTTNGLDIIKVDDILRCEASQSYCKIYLSDNRSMFVSKSLSEVEKMVGFSNVFFRTHSSHLVNLEHVMKLSTLDGDSIYMINEDSVPLARRRKKEFLEALRTKI